MLGVCLTGKFCQKKNICPVWTQALGLSSSNTYTHAHTSARICTGIYTVPNKHSCTTHTHKKKSCFLIFKKHFGRTKNYRSNCQVCKFLLITTVTIITHNSVMWHFYINVCANAYMYQVHWTYSLPQTPPMLFLILTWELDYSCSSGP